MPDGAAAGCPQPLNPPTTSATRGTGSRASWAGPWGDRRPGAGSGACAVTVTSREARRNRCGAGDGGGRPLVPGLASPGGCARLGSGHTMVGRPVRRCTARGVPRAGPRVAGSTRPPVGPATLDSSCRGVERSSLSTESESPETPRVSGTGNHHAAQVPGHALGEATRLPSVRLALPGLSRHVHR